MKTLAGLLLALVLAAVAPVTVLAEEFIKSYHSDIEVGSDGTLTVTETITVNAEGQDIRRGIFRDFPLYRKDAKNRTIKVGFDLLSVRRDGQPEDYHTEDISRGIRIYAGNANVFLQSGFHTYEIRYRTDRQILFYNDQDEVYWNVTGNGWMFPIDQASATVHLPSGTRVVETDVYTGYEGDADKDAKVSISKNTVDFETTQPLSQYAGLTILVAMPKGVISEPSQGEQLRWWLTDHLGELIGFGGLAVIFLYYLRSWISVGRDPAAGVVVPRWDAPDGISPALVNYIDNTGFGGRPTAALSASAVDLAVKGYVELDDLKKTLVIRRTDKAVSGELPVGQKYLLKEIGSAGESLTFNKGNGERVKDVVSGFSSAIEAEHRGKYYKHNFGYIAGGVALSIVTVTAMFVFGNLQEEFIPLVVVVGMFSFVIGGFAPSIGRTFRPSASFVSRIGAILALAFLAMFLFSFASTMLLAFVSDILGGGEGPILFAFGGIFLINALFLFLMGAPTPLGRKMMDGIAGLRTYLTLAEKDRMNMAGAPTMSPKHYETLLPYAIALRVEKPWSRAFEAWLATATAAAAASAYNPAWYHGTGNANIADSVGKFSSSMASTISSSIPQPKSSSGGGGGSSGGGGGGGGGGGW